MTMKLRTVSAAGCEVRMGLAILVSPELCSPTVILCWSCVLMDFPPTLCLIWSANTKYSALNLYPLNPTSFWGRGGVIAVCFFKPPFSRNSWHALVNGCVTFECA